MRDEKKKNDQKIKNKFLKIFYECITRVIDDDMCGWSKIKYFCA